MFVMFSLHAGPGLAEPGAILITNDLLMPTSEAPLVGWRSQPFPADSHHHDTPLLHLSSKLFLSNTSDGWNENIVSL